MTAGVVVARAAQCSGVLPYSSRAVRAAPAARHACTRSGAAVLKNAAVFHPAHSAAWAGRPQNGPRGRTTTAVKSHSHDIDSLLTQLLTAPLARPYFLGFLGGCLERVEKVQ